jgi:hypothetical protein
VAGVSSKSRDTFRVRLRRLSPFRSPETPRLKTYFFFLAAFFFAFFLAAMMASFRLLV